jgi:hypothetical protein
VAISQEKRDLELSTATETPAYVNGSLRVTLASTLKSAAAEFLFCIDYGGSAAKAFLAACENRLVSSYD